MRLISFVAIVAFSFVSDSFTFKVVSYSMYNTLKIEQIVNCEKSKSILRNDIIVFNEDYYSKGKEDAWIYRVIGISGDSVRIRNGNVFVNSIKEKPISSIKLQYQIKSKHDLVLSFLDESSCITQTSNEVVAFLSTNEIALIRKTYPSAKIARVCNYSSEGIISPEEGETWNSDNFGMLYIPRVGDTVKINERNKLLYHDIIGDGMPNDSTIVVKEKLYFVLGDNRYSAADSRFIGFVSESKIIGKVVSK
ncbi:signal peptidase I [uncultured Acetobacteroides sp.]|uniref:signal peptidase I n=1 Tax=uncultured Acetobacteroides sp. TaxID=1760811 RepID=UPI0029F4A162|nr:signal peptidase I [uncultured Acetobacteroides sp.]